MVDPRPHLYLQDLRAILTNKGYQKALLCAFLAALVAYSIFVFSFPLHNHHPRLPWTGYDPGLDRGNWAWPLIHWILYEADLPVLSPVLAIIFLVCAGALATFLIYRNVGRFGLFLGSTFIAVFPFNIAIFYYTFLSPAFALAHLLAVGSVALSSRREILTFVLRGGLAFLAISTYQPALTTIATFVVISMLTSIQRCGKAGVSVPLAALFRTQFLPLCSATFLGVLTYGISTKFASGDHYSLGSKTFLESFRDVPDIILAAYGHFFITQPELLLITKIVLLFICIVGGICFVSKQLKSGLSHAGVSLILLLLLPLAAKALFFISTSTNYFIYRYNPGLQYAYLFFALTALQSIDIQGRRWIAILGHGLILFLLLRFIQADLVYQGLHLRGVQHDLAITNRILARVESLPTLDFEREYRIFFYGDLPQARKDWFDTGDPMPPVIDFWPNRGGPNYHATGAQHAYRSFPDYWNTESGFALLGARIKMKRIGTYLSEATQKVENHLANKPQGVWPADDSVFIIDDIIVIRLKE